MTSIKRPQISNDARHGVPDAYVPLQRPGILSIHHISESDED